MHRLILTACPEASLTLSYEIAPPLTDPELTTPIRATLTP